MIVKQLIVQITKDVRVEITDEFDQNFNRKAFFDKPWQKRKRAERRGSLMILSGRLRRSIRSTIRDTKIVFQSDAPYADIHNKGGKINVTPKMRKFFWAMYYKNTQGVSFSVKTKQAAGRRSQSKNSEAQYWRGLALKKKGVPITIPKRQFIGHHPTIDKAIDRIATARISEYVEKELLTVFKQ